MNALAQLHADNAVASIAEAIAMVDWLAEGSDDTVHAVIRRHLSVARELLLITYPSDEQVAR